MDVLESRKRPLQYDDLCDEPGLPGKIPKISDIEEGEIPEENKEKIDVTEKPPVEDGNLSLEHSENHSESGKSKDKERREKDREISRSHSDRDKNRERDSDKRRKEKRERDRSREREREKEREKARFREREKEKQREKHRERERDREKREREKQREKEREKEKERKRSEQVKDETKKPKEILEKREEDTEEYRQKVAAQLEQILQGDDEEKLRKARERREAILRKYKEQKPEPTSQENPQPESHLVEEKVHPIEEQEELTGKHSTSSSGSVQETPGDSELAEKLFPALPEASFNMFCESPTGEKDGKVLPKLEVFAANMAEVIDDAEGYYCYRVGEILNGKYQLMGGFGKGVFSTVVRAKDLQNEEKEVAIKVLRNNEAMKRMGHKEVQILKELATADPDNKYNIIRLLDSFEDREHLCLVFEPMNGGNLREVLRKYGTRIGLSIKAVKFYGQKLMMALKLLKKAKMLHADIKLDNILVNETKTSIRLGDLGSASSVTDNAITPYLVSRFYRAPEIILGLPYSYELDMWAVGCCLYEICTGKMLFPGKTNNEMLYLHMEVAGPMPRKMIKRGEFASVHFDEIGNFKRLLKDNITQREYIKIVNLSKPTRDLKEELLNSPYDLSPEEEKMITQLHDLLMQIFVLDPSKRIPVEKALRHEFFTSN